MIIGTTVLATFVWNWFIHMAYHQPGHWLEQFDWFNYDRQMHLIHHVDPKKNYGISSHFSDWGFGTYESSNQYRQFYPSADIKGTYISLNPGVINDE